MLAPLELHRTTLHLCYPPWNRTEPHSIAPDRSSPLPTTLNCPPSLPTASDCTCSNLHSGALTDPGASEVLSVGATATARLVTAFIAGSGATSPTTRLSFTLDSGASSYFFRACTDLTPLHTPVTVALADSSVGSVVAESTTTLPCQTTSSGFLTGYYTPSFSRNLVGVSHLHDLRVVTTFPLHEPVASCTVDATGAPLATFHREPGSGVLELLAPLPRSPAPLCTPCVEGRQRAAPHSSSFPPTTAPLQTLHLDIWGPSPVLGPRQERYFLIVVDDYSRYTTVFPLRRKAEVPTVLEPWLLARGGVQGLCGLRLHSDRGATPPSRPAPSGVSHVTPQSSPPQRLVPVVSGGSGGAAVEGEGTRAAGACRASSGGAGDVGVETTLEEDSAVSTQRPRTASPPDLPSVLQFLIVHLRGRSLRSLGVFQQEAMEPLGVFSVEVLALVVLAPETRALQRLRHALYVSLPECSVMTGESRGGVAAAAAVSVGASGESRGVTAAAAVAVSVGESGEIRGGVTAAAGGVSVGASGEGRGGVTAAAAAAVSVKALGESRGGVMSAAGAGTVAADARGGEAAATTTARPARPSTSTLGSWSSTVPSCSPRPVPVLVPVDSSFSP
ncbi:unnamed protein product [Closterium sp. NIES-53]